MIVLTHDSETALQTYLNGGSFTTIDFVLAKGGKFTTIVTT